MGKSIGTEEKHLRLLEEGKVANLWQTGQSKKYTDDPYLGPTCPALGRVFTSCKGHGSWSVGIAEQAQSENCCWLWETHWGDGREEFHSRECLQKKTGLPWKQSTTAESHVGGEATIVASLSPHTGACQRTIKETLSGLALTRWSTNNKKKPPQGWPSPASCRAIKKKGLSGLVPTRWLPGARKSLASAGPHAPYARCQKRPSLGPYLLCLWPLASLHIWHCWGFPASRAVIPPLRPVLTGAHLRAPTQPQDQTPLGGTHEEVGIKPKLNLRKGVTKEEDCKSFHQVYKLQIKSPWSAR